VHKNNEGKRWIENDIQDYSFCGGMPWDSFLSVGLVYV